LTENVKKLKNLSFFPPLVINTVFYFSTTPHIAWWDQQVRYEKVVIDTLRFFYENLMRLGIPINMAWQWTNTRKGCWCISGSIIMCTAMNNRYLETLGFPNILKKYEELRERAKRLEILHGIC